MAFFKSATVTWLGCLAGKSTDTVGRDEYLTVTETMVTSDTALADEEDVLHVSEIKVDSKTRTG